MRLTNACWGKLSVFQVVLALAMGSLAVRQADAGPFLFWSEFESGIWRGELSEGGLKNPTRIVEAQHPYRLDVDLPGGKVYWAGGKDSPGVFAAGLDGSSPTQIFQDPALTFPYGIDVDGSDVYWTDHDSAALWKAKSDGSLAAVIPLNLANPHDLEVGGALLYFQTQNPGNIHVVDKDGGPLRGFPVRPAIMSGPHGLSVDADRRMLVWTNHTTASGSQIYISPLPDPVSGFIDGDANGDNEIDLTDFGILKDNFGSSGDWTQANFNGDLKVDLSDFGLLKQNFGGPRGIGGSEIDNPGAVVLDGEGIGGTPGTIYWGQPSGLYRAVPQQAEPGVITYSVSRILDHSNIQGVALAFIPDGSNEAVVVPEPAAICLLIAGAGCLGAASFTREARRRRGDR